ncbi:hypothetical protein ACIA8G_41950 [Lentzea sp. NPDC051213]|uniref:hypothetical protein n=1 Tax=Lentzea sp. NPDC051213 TaxID=3364126 RepID=UPI0037887F70
MPRAYVLTEISVNATGPLTPHQELRNNAPIHDDFRTDPLFESRWLMPSMRTAEDNWRKIPYTTKSKLRVISFDDDKVDVKYSGNGAWVYLEGMEVTLGKDVFDAHITVTKSPVGDLRTDSDPWTPCHLTLTRAYNNHVFYKWDETNQRFNTTSEVIDPKGKHRSAKDHFAIEESQINDPKLVSAVKDDMTEIFLNLV